MGVEYRIDIKNTAGTLVAVVTDFLDLSCTKQVGGVDLGTFELNANHGAVALLADKYQVEYWRRWPEMEIDWYVFFSGLFRDDVIEDSGDGIDYFNASCPGYKSILSWRENLYISGTANKTTWSSKPLETIMKDLVRNNFTSTGTTGNGRDRNATSSGAVNGFTITIEADSARGTVLSHSSTRSNVLKEIQEVASAAGSGDFDLVKTGDATWQFRYYPLLGTDRTATVAFARERGNIRRPKLARIRSEERTAIVVGGGGQKERRVIRTRTGANYSTSNDIEMFYNGATTTGSTTNTATLDALGDKEANKRRMRAKLGYEVVQTPGSLLDVHYFLGDKVTAHHAGVTLTQQVYSISMAYRTDGSEELRIGMRDY